jgi:putative glutamine amidotransferase
MNYAESLYLAGAAAAALPTPFLDPEYYGETAPPAPPENNEEIRLVRRNQGGGPLEGYLVGKGRVPAGSAGGGVDGCRAYMELARECLSAGLGGLILSGGGDVGADPRDKPGLPPALARLDKARDRWEAALFLAALELGLPVLGVCRGLQLMNAVLGGTLWEDIGEMVPGAIPHIQAFPRTRASHAVSLEPGSLIARLSGAESINVNSGHHQAVNGLGKGLRATGWTSDGIIEAAELPPHDFVLGIQWHPEGLARSDPRSMALFTGLANAARRALAARAGRRAGAASPVKGSTRKSLSAGPASGAGKSAGATSGSRKILGASAGAVKSARAPAGSRKAPGAPAGSRKAIEASSGAEPVPRPSGSGGPSPEEGACPQGEAQATGKGRRE